MKTIPLHRVLLVLLALFASAIAADLDLLAQNSRTGRIVSIEGNTLKLHTFRGHSGIVQEFQIDPAVKVIVDGKEAKLADLKAEQWIKVSWTDDPRTITRIEPAKSPWGDGPASRPATTQAATQAALQSKAAVRDGLSVVVTLEKASVAADEAIKFTVKFTNVSDKPFELYDADYQWGWQMTFTDERGGPWRVVNMFEAKRAPRDPVTLQPGQSLDAPALLDPASGWFKYRWAGEQLASPVPIERLRPGRYTLAVDIALRAMVGARRPNPCWTGQIATEPVQIEIK